jgi:trigger factor
MDFHSEVKELDAVTREVTVKIPHATLEAETQSKLKKVAVTAKIKGFRPGKAPKHIIEKLYGAQARYEALNDATVKSLDRVISTNSWRVVGQPEVKFNSLTESVAKESEQTDEAVMDTNGSDLEFSAKIYLYPQPELSGYDSFKVEVEKKVITDEDVLKVINRQLEERADVNPVTGRDILQAGDIAKGDLTEKTACNHGSEENCEHDHHEHTHTEPVTFKVGEGRWSADLEQQVLGQKIGDTKTLTFKPNPEATEDQIRQFEFKLSEIMEQILPELTDELVVELKVPEVATVEQLKERVKKDLIAEEERLCRERVQSEVIKQLSAANDFIVPQVMVDEEIKAIVQGEYQRYGQKITLEEIQVERFKEAYQQPALERIKNGILMFSIAEKEQLLATAQDLDDLLQKLAKEYNIAQEQVKSYLSQDGQLTKMRNDISLRKVLEFLESRAEVSYLEAQK